MFLSILLCLEYMIFYLNSLNADLLSSISQRITFEVQLFIRIFIKVQIFHHKLLLTAMNIYIFHLVSVCHTYFFQNMFLQLSLE